MKRLLVIGDLSVGTDQSIDAAVVALAVAMAEANIGIVCLGGSGGPSGLIPRMAATVKARGGHVTSVMVANPLSAGEHLATDCDDLLLADSRHECKALLSSLSDGVLVLPGGVGTLDILMEYLTWLHRSYPVRPVYIANVAGFWSPLLEMFDRMNDKWFLPDDFGRRYVLVDDINNVIPHFKTSLGDDRRGRDAASRGDSSTTTPIPKTTSMQVCVYCGSTTGKDPTYAEAAETLGTAIAAGGLGLVYGGGKSGLMGILATAALSNGGQVTGIMPRSLVDSEHPFASITNYLEVDSYHERKTHMCNLADLLIALPGGPGTLEEVVEQLAWVECGYHRKPICIVNVDGYWDPLLWLLEQMRHQMSRRRTHGSPYVVVDRPEQALELLSKRGEYHD